MLLSFKSHRQAKRLAIKEAKRIARENALLVSTSPERVYLSRLKSTPLLLWSLKACLLGTIFMPMRHACLGPAAAPSFLAFASFTVFYVFNKPMCTPVGFLLVYYISLLVLGAAIYYLLHFRVLDKKTLDGFMGGADLTYAFWGNAGSHQLAKLKWGAIIALGYKADDYRADENVTSMCNKAKEDGFATDAETRLEMKLKELQNQPFHAVTNYFGGIASRAADTIMELLKNGRK